MSHQEWVEAMFSDNLGALLWRRDPGPPVSTPPREYGPDDSLMDGPSSGLADGCLSVWGATSRDEACIASLEELLNRPQSPREAHEEQWRMSADWGWGPGYDNFSDWETEEGFDWFGDPTLRDPTPGLVCPPPENPTDDVM